MKNCLLVVVCLFLNSTKIDILAAIHTAVMNVKTTIVEDIRTNQLRWYGHVVRMERERLPKQVLLWTPQGRRRKGRRRRSGTDGVE
jgi:hypothetical protein